MSIPSDRIPIVATGAAAPSCSLPPDDLGRRRVALADLARAATDHAADDQGITLRFPFSDELLETAWSAVRAETGCCRDFRYVLAIEPSRGVFGLAVRTEVPGHARWLRSVYLENPGEGALDERA